MELHKILFLVILFCVLALAADELKVFTGVKHYQHGLKNKKDLKNFVDKKRKRGRKTKGNGIKGTIRRGNDDEDEETTTAVSTTEKVKIVYVPIYVDSGYNQDDWYNPEGGYYQDNVWYPNGYQGYYPDQGSVYEEDC